MVTIGDQVVSTQCGQGLTLASGNHRQKVGVGSLTLHCAIHTLPSILKQHRSGDATDAIAAEGALVLVSLWQGHVLDGQCQLSHTDQRQIIVKQLINQFALQFGTCLK